MLAGIACNNSKTNPAKPGEGTVTYSITYPDSTQFSIKSVFFPRNLTLVFKDEKAAFITSAGMGTVQLVNLLNYKTKSYTSLLIDELRGNYACKLTETEIKNNESNPEYEFELTDVRKEIAGIMCNKAIVKDMTNHTTSELYYYDKIKFHYWNSPFKDLHYLFAEYTHTINNLTLKLSAVKIDLTTPVDTGLFSVKGNYTWVTEKEFFERISKL